MRLFSANEGTLEPYLSQFDVEKLEMASVMGICGSLVGPKSGNVEKVVVFKAFLSCQEGREYAKPANNRAATGFFGALWGHSGLVWDHIRMTLGHFGLTLST